jgi:hypothetical protein
MSNEVQLGIFDAYGRLRDLGSDADVATIEALSEDDRTKLFACIAAVTATEAGATRKVVSIRRVVELDAAYNAALAAWAKSSPPQTQADNVRHHAAASRAGYVPEPVKINKTTRKNLDVATASLADARSEMNIANRELKELEAVSATATNVWRLCLTTPSAEENVRAYVNRSAQDRADRFAATGNAEIVAPVPAQQCELERVLQARGRTKIRGPVFSPAGARGR